jgi:predicted phosphoribosyltransferase
VFRDRVDAGQQLAPQLVHLGAADAVVVGLPRGGVVVAAQVATWLGAPLDVIVVRKLGAPPAPEVAMGALGEGGVVVVNDDVVRRARVTPAEFDQVLAREQALLEARVTELRRGRPHIPLADRVAIVVDDGIATGATARAACDVARAGGAARVVLAVPVVAADVLTPLRRVVDEVVFVSAPEEFRAVGEWYRDFTQVTDDEVVALLQVSPSGAP